MARTVITLINPTFVVADDEAGLATGEAFECQLTTAQLVPAAVTNQIPATGCAPVSNVPGKSSWGLSLAWLQDWTDPGGGLSNYCIVNEATLKWFELVLDVAGAPTVAATGQVYVAAGQFGGVFGGPPAPATATWPVLGTPVFVVPPAAPLAADTAEPELELEHDTAGA